MNHMRWNLMGLVTALAVSVTACGQAVDRLGNEPAARVALHGEIAVNPDEAAEYVRELERLSGSALTVSVEQAEDLSADAEPSVVERVRSGAVDVGFVGTRVWQGYDVHDFDALHAPLLVDSYDVERSVLESPILDGVGVGLADLGLVSVGVLAGPLRLPAGRDAALASPEDYAGKRIAISKSPITDATMRALGAEPGEIGIGTAVDGFDGMEAQIAAMRLGGPAGMRYVTGNVVLWPRPLSVVVNKARYDALTVEQQGMLRAAARDSMEARINNLIAFERETLGSACRLGVTVVQATASDRTALRTAVEPVYEALRADPATATAIDAIAALKPASRASLTCPSDAVVATASPVAVATPIDGTWRACPTEADIIAAGGMPNEARDNAGCWTVRLEQGTFFEDGDQAATSAAGSYNVDGDQLTINRSNGERFQFTWTLYKDQLSLGLPADPQAISPAPARALPLIRQDG